tara:strand:+ start:131 stop:340 length:210 start_codon:yes stop_codon:yes gene_type:complete
MQNLLNSAFGSYVKTFLSVLLTLVLTQLASGLSVLELDWAIIGNGALVSFLPVIINALNPKDSRYGKTE